jgi:hypothetical protein
MRRSRVALVLCLVVIVAVVAVEAEPFVSPVEQPSYKVDLANGAFEVRTYPATIVAEVETRGGRRAAIGDGFRLIAGYIFGNNAPREKVAMTAPVLQQATDGGEGERSWTIRFTMPKSWSMQTLPKPSDPRVRLATRPAATFAVVRFSGLAGDATIAEKIRALTSFVSTQRLQTVAQPILAFYDPPWTLPFLRRNEIMVEVMPP